jgi:hypothetical protein
MLEVRPWLQSALGYSLKNEQKTLPIPYSVSGRSSLCAEPDDCAAPARSVETLPNVKPASESLVAYRPVLAQQECDS